MNIMNHGYGFWDVWTCMNMKQDARLYASPVPFRIERSPWHIDGRSLGDTKSTLEVGPLAPIHSYVKII